MQMTALRASARFTLALAAILLFASACDRGNSVVSEAHAQSLPPSPPGGEARFLEARDAVRSGDRDTLQRLVNASNGHPLDGYVRYWLLSSGLNRNTPPASDEIQDFLMAESGNLLANLLRADWLRYLARRNDWAQYTQVYADIRDPDGELKCLSWHARLETGNASVIKEIAGRWSTLTSAHAACSPILRTVIETGSVSADEAWQLFRLRVDGGTPATARVVLGWITPGREKSFNQAITKSQKYLDKLPAGFSGTRAGRELALAAIARLARSNFDNALTRFERISPKLTENERKYGWGLLARHAAQEHRSVATSMFRKAGDIPLTEKQRDWRARAALRQLAWPDVIAAIDKLTPPERELPEWQYWRARALKATRHKDEADQIFQKLSATPNNFYGLLSAEELGVRFDPKSLPKAAEAAKGVEHQIGFRRAIALLRLDMRAEGVREWNWNLRDRDETFRLAAAHLAMSQNIYDRAISSADQATPVAAWDLRFPTPYRSLIAPEASAQGLDLAWVYGIMRQESRFIAPARSAVGAQGLMQVMPATGRLVAKRLGMSYSASALQTPETNVKLGTGYMRIILDELEQNMVLASAGYNAGPGRARRWRDEIRPLEGALYIDTIPIDETRDYVRKVMANATVYDALINGKPQSIKSRLGTISAKTGPDELNTDTAGTDKVEAE